MLSYAIGIKRKAMLKLKEERISYEDGISICSAKIIILVDENKV